MKHHPDKGGNPEEFKKIQGAFDILSDPEKRESYDRFGLDGPPQQQFHHHFGQDVFSQIFSGFAQQQQQQHENRRRDIMHALSITLEESFKGTVKHLKITLSKTCFSCQTKCETCNGSGRVHISLGPMSIVQPCSACESTGVRNTGCNKCTRGVKKETFNLEINVPKGTKNGDSLVSKGFGEQAKHAGEIAGDLVVLIQVADHVVFMRRNDDLLYNVRISFKDSVNGITLNCPHFDGNFEINTRPYGIIDPRKEYPVAGKGFNNGCMQVSFDVVYPEPPTI